MLSRYLDAWVLVLFTLWLESTVVKSSGLSWFVSASVRVLQDLMSKVLPLQKSTLANVVRYIGGINTHQFRPLKALWTSIVSRTQWWHPETSNHWIISSLTKHKQTGVRKFEVRWSQLLGAPLKSCEFSSKVWAATPPWSNRSTLKHGVMWLVRLLLYLYWFVNPCVGTWIYSQVYCFCMLLFQEDIKKCFGGSVNSALRRFEKSRPTPHRCNIRIVRVIPCKMLPQAVSPYVYIGVSSEFRSKKS